MTIVEAARGITGGVDTHRCPCSRSLDPLGGLLGSESFSTDGGYGLLSGSRALATSSRSAWRAPAPMARVWPVTCAGPA